jgi:hypothetical protein
MFVYLLLVPTTHGPGDEEEDQQLSQCDEKEQSLVSLLLHSETSLKYLYGDVAERSKAPR